MTRTEEMIDDEHIKRIETQWKSDVDLKLDHLVSFANKYEKLLEMLIAREEKRERLRAAIIEKTLSALILAAVVGLLTLAWNGLSMELKAAYHSLRSTK